MGSNAEYAMSTLSRKVAEQDARIAELTAEVAWYKAANADLVKTLDVIGGLSMARRVGGPDPMDLHELDRAVEIAIDMAHEAIDRNSLKDVSHD